MKDSISGLILAFGSFYLSVWFAIMVEGAAGSLGMFFGFSISASILYLINKVFGKLS